MAPFRLAHLSDPHLLWTTPRGVELLGKRGLSALNWARRRSAEHRLDVADRLRAHLLEAAPDAIAVTGDVVNFALPGEFTAARPWLETLGSPDKVLVIPGNHEAIAGNWSDAMRRAWGPYAPDLPRLTRHGPLGLIQLSTACVTPPFMASGRLSDPDAAPRLIAEAEEAGLLPVVLMHHPPTRMTPRRKGLAEMSRVQRALSRAALILHGHTHRADLSTFAGPHGPVPVIGVPSFSMTPTGRHPAGAWRLLSFEGNTLTVAEHALASDMTIRTRTPLRFVLPGGGVTG